ncbi:hypothetical protein Hanom_Chr17g01553421 [Helianthus anomalus]
MYNATRSESIDIIRSEPIHMKQLYSSGKCACFHSKESRYYKQDLYNYSSTLTSIQTQQIHFYF